MSEIVKKLSKEDLSQEALKREGLVLVDFWAEWCGPCRMLAPVVEEIAAETQGTIAVGKLNIDECVEFVMSLGISSIPTLILYKGGAEVERIIGVQSKTVIMDLIQHTM